MAQQDNKEITIYGTAGCPACAAAQKFLTTNKIPYNYVNVGIDITPSEFIKLTNSQSVPVIIIKNDNMTEKHIGWNPDLFK